MAWTPSDVPYLAEHLVGRSVESIIRHEDGGIALVLDDGKVVVAESLRLLSASQSQAAISRFFDRNAEVLACFGARVEPGREPEIEVRLAERRAVAVRQRDLAAVKAPRRKIERVIGDIPAFIPEVTAADEFGIDESEVLERQHRTERLRSEIPDVFGGGV